MLRSLPPPLVRRTILHGRAAASEFTPLAAVPPIDSEAAVCRCRLQTVPACSGGLCGSRSRDRTRRAACCCRACTRRCRAALRCPRTSNARMVRAQLVGNFFVQVFVLCVLMLLQQVVLLAVECSAAGTGHWRMNR